MPETVWDINDSAPVTLGPDSESPTAENAWNLIDSAPVPLAPAFAAPQSEQSTFHYGPVASFHFAAESGGGTTHDVSLTESVTASDSQSAVFTTNASLTESTTASDFEIVTLTATGSLTEAVTSSDSQVVTLTGAGLLTESLTASESETAIFTVVAALTEATTASESETGGVANSVALTEALTVADAQMATFVAETAITESVTSGASEAGTYETLTALIESVGAGDSTTGGASVVGAIIESAEALASETASAVFGSSLPDGLAASDLTTGSYETPASVDEHLAASDEQSSGTFGNVNESLSAGESSAAGVILAPVVSPFPIVTMGGAGWWPTPREVRQVVTQHVSLSERIHATDSAVTFSVSSRQVSETLSAGGSQSSSVTTGEGVSESASCESVASGQCEFAGGVTELTKASESTMAELIPWVLETIKFDGAILCVHNDSTISLEIEPGVLVDIVVSKGEASGVLEIPIYELI